MKTIKTVLLIYLVALISVTILPYFSVFNSLGNLILVLALFYISQKDLKQGILWAFLGGLFLDFLSPGFPSNFLIASGIVLLTNFILTNFFEISNVFIYPAFCFFATLIYNFILILVYSQNLRVFLIPLILSAFYSFLMAILVSLAHKYLFKAKNKSFYVERL